MSLDVTDGMHRFSEAVGVPSPPHIIFWPFSLHGSTSYFLYSWRRLPCLASQSCLLSLHSWLFISIFDISLEVVPFEVVIVIVHATQRNGSFFQWTLEMQVLLNSSFFFIGCHRLFPSAPPPSFFQVWIKYCYCVHQTREDKAIQVFFLSLPPYLDQGEKEAPLAQVWGGTVHLL